MNWGLLAFLPEVNMLPCVGMTVDDTVSAIQLKRILATMRLLGQPLAPADEARVVELAGHLSAAGAAAEVQKILGGYTLMNVHLDRHGVGTAQAGGALWELAESGWRSFLVRVENPARLTGAMQLISHAAFPEGDIQSSIHDSHILGNDVAQSVRIPPDVDSDYDREPSQWMGYRFGSGAEDRGLEGALIEYQIVQIYSQAGGSKRAFLAASSATIPLARTRECKGFEAQVTCCPASNVSLDIRDWDGAGTTAWLIIRDGAGRLYPAPAHRLEPDLGYQLQIYRAHGEMVRLPEGRFSIVAQRGPEYFKCEKDLLVTQGGLPTDLSLHLKRWINPPALGWYPGEPHIHPEGQAYGIVSKLGLTPESILRQVRGEALTVGSVLIWTGGYYYEKQFLTGRVYRPDYQLPFPDRQRANNVAWTPQRTPHDAESLVRYDVEQAAFPSNRFGHPILLRLKNHCNPFGRSIWEWPSWNLPVLQWARSQDAVTGYAHSGHGLSVNSSDLPNFDVPALEGLGANECLVDVCHGLVDFLAGGENAPIADLNLWYHLLNCGFAIPMIGETDFPVGSLTRRIGTVRTYVGLDGAPDGDAGYRAWVEGIKAGRLYFGDGRSHLIDFRANEHPLGSGVLALRHPGRINLSVKVAAWLSETPSDPDADPQALGYTYWHIERARLGQSRKVSLEVLMNGKVVERRDLLADGALNPIGVSIDVLQSCWIALRILPSAHTAPIMISVREKPVRASKRSARWCLDCIEVLWEKHAWRIRKTERAAAAAAWDHARAVYRSIAIESEVD